MFYIKPNTNAFLYVIYNSLGIVVTYNRAKLLLETDASNTTEK